MKLAKFKRLGEHSYETITEEWADGCRDYVRLSEYVEVEFPPLRDEAIVERQLEALDRTENALRTQFQQALSGIEQQRAELRAITYTPAQRTDGSVDEYLQ